MAKNLEDWRKAGHAAHEALVYGASLIKVGAKFSDVSDAVESKLKELGADLGFPVNISLNTTAAHDVPFSKEDREFTENDVIKLDVGSEVNGAIGDNAMTVDLTGKWSKLSQASKDARDNAIKILKPGVKLKEIGKVIEDTIHSFGYEPIKNLSGHSVDEYVVHAGVTIPNFDNGDETELTEGMVIAIEPFATDGEGLIHEANNAEIFKLEEIRPVRSPYARKALELLKDRQGLPTSTRWLAKRMGALQATLALKELNNMDMLHTYPPLVENRKGMVAQWEHTILITKDGHEVLTN